jgi:tRNA-specific 2-thiouridylase
MFYTLGQRQGLGIGGLRNGDGDAWYVAEKDMARNRLTVVQGHDHAQLFSDRVTAVNLNWIAGVTPHCGWVYGAKTRYRQKDAPCIIASATRQSCSVEFAEPQWAVTPGQSVVVYESNVCLGGGIIESASLSADGADAIRQRQETCP